MTPKDWTLLVIAAAAGRPVSPVQLQKTLFLLSRNLSPSDLKVGQLYDFEPYDYGPFDGSIYHDAERLEREDLVLIDEARTRFRSYRVTPDGQAEAGELRSQLSPRVVNYLDRLLAWVRSLSFNQLVEAIYNAHPEMAKNSVYKR